MAERRMFAKSIVMSDAFLDMPLSARCLYFTLGMFADDDGFVNSPKGIMRQCGASQDDMNILIAKQFVILFDTGVIVIKHWRIHNYIQNDRYKETVCMEEKSLLSITKEKAYSLDINSMDTECIQNGYNMDTQVSIGKESIDKSRLVGDKKEKEEHKCSSKKKDQFVIPTVDEVREYCQSVGSQIDPEHFHAFYESKGWLVGNSKMKSWKAAIVTWEKKGGLKRIPPKQPEEPQSRFSCIPKEFYEELKSKGAIDDEDCLHYGNITKDELKRLEEYGVSL